MALPRPADLSLDLLEDFRLDAAEQFPRCEQLLIELENFPHDSQRLRELFRLVHTLKGNLGFVGLNHLMPLPQALEDVLSKLREDALEFDSLLGDILLLTLDRLRALISEALGGPDARMTGKEMDAMSQALRALAAAPAARQTEIRRTLLQQMAPETRLQQPTANVDSPELSLLLRYGIQADADLLFFTDLMKAAEQRSQYWRGRGQRLLNLALAMNEQADRPEQPAQLAAAVCLHDLGMAFLPLEILHKQEHLNREERRQMQAHPRLAFDLLKRMPQWSAAAEIVLQHQEQVDGNGYPKGLTEREMSPGALILSIVDTFDARTHERAHQTLSKRPLLRAILEINSLAGKQFSPHWVEIFNRTLQQLPELTRI
jgi:HD-GYP domain-containing protein (c-di-GMP phosphodiesterase class II)